MDELKEELKDSFIKPLKTPLPLDKEGQGDLTPKNG
jgi:hypothetical protein